MTIVRIVNSFGWNMRTFGANNNKFNLNVIHFPLSVRRYNYKFIMLPLLWVYEWRDSGASGLKFCGFPFFVHEQIGIELATNKTKGNQ